MIWVNIKQYFLIQEDAENLIKNICLKKNYEQYQDFPVYSKEYKEHSILVKYEKLLSKNRDGDIISVSLSKNNGKSLLYEMDSIQSGIYTELTKEIFNEIRVIPLDATLKFISNKNERLNELLIKHNFKDVFLPGLYMIKDKYDIEFSLFTKPDRSLQSEDKIIITSTMEGSKDETFNPNYTAVRMEKYIDRLLKIING